MLINVIFKVSLLDSAIRELHPSYAMLDSFVPLALITGSVNPLHLTISLPFIVFIISSINVAALPDKHSETILLIVLITAFVGIAVRLVDPLLPLALPMLQTVLKLTDIHTSIFPFVLP